MEKPKEFELSFRNPEVRMYTGIIFPFVIAGILVIIFSSSELKFLYTFILQTIGLASFYIWRLFYRRKNFKITVDVLFIP